MIPQPTENHMMKSVLVLAACSFGLKRVMRNIIRAGIAAVVVSLGFAGPLAAGPLEDGLAAYEREDYVTAIQVLRPLADRGNADAQARLGWMYHYGEGVPQDDATAATWYRKAADQGDADSQSTLGFLYEYGKGVPQDDATAASWYRKAADQGSARAQVDLGYMYDHGQGVPRDYVAAHMWFSLAAAGGLKQALTSRDGIAAKMTPEQIAEAEKRFARWQQGGQSS
jgi:uncharacterized protein